MALDAHIKAIGFDMDGTIMDTKVDYVKLARVVEDEFIDLGVPTEVIDQDKVASTMNYGIKWLMENKPESLVGMEKRIGDRATVIECENASIAKPFPGAVELIKDLKSMGYKVAILTRGGREYAEKILTASGIIGLFDALVARDDYPQAEAKPSPKSMEHMCEKIGVDPKDTIYVGDGTVDWLTAVNSGSQFIGVESGHTDREAWVKAAGADIVTVPTVAEIRQFL